MKKTNKLVVFILLMSMVVSMLAGCGSNDTTGQNDGASDGAKKVKVGLIALGFGTQSFNDDVLDGLKAAEGEPLMLFIKAVGSAKQSARGKGFTLLNFP